MRKDELTDMLRFRHACKHFDPHKTLTESQLRFILEAGRLAPSSFGMEPWRFLVLRDQKLKERLSSACWNQPQITDCSHLVVVLALVDDPVRRPYYEAMFRRRSLPEEQLQAYLGTYRHFIDELHSVYGWVARQCYIAAAHMMIYAAGIGVDSCPIEGFEKEKVEEILGLNTTKEQVALLLPLGFRAQEQGPKTRKPFEEVVRFL